MAVRCAKLIIDVALKHLLVHIAADQQQRFLIKNTRCIAANRTVTKFDPHISFYSQSRPFWLATYYSRNVISCILYWFLAFPVHPFISYFELQNISETLQTSFCEFELLQYPAGCFFEEIISNCCGVLHNKIQCYMFIFSQKIMIKWITSSKKCRIEQLVTCW